MKVSECVPAAVVVLSGAVASLSITAIASFVLLYCHTRGLSSQWGGIFYCSKIKYRKYIIRFTISALFANSHSKSQNSLW